MLFLQVRIPGLDIGTHNKDFSRSFGLLKGSRQVSHPHLIFELRKFREDTKITAWTEASARAHISEFKSVRS